MRWVAALVLAAVASSAAAKPTTIHNESRTWAKGDIDTLVAADGFVVIALTTRDSECEACAHSVTHARELFEIDAPGVWHVYVMYVDGRTGSADEIVPGARRPVIALYAGGHLIAARASNASRDDATAWLERNAARAAKLDGASPLDCAQRLIDLVISPGRIGADDLVRMRDLRARHAAPASKDHLASAWGVLSSFEIAPRGRDLELGDLVIDTRNREPTLLLVDQPTTPNMFKVEGTRINDDGTTEHGWISLATMGDDMDPPLREDVFVVRPVGGTFCSAQ